MTTDHVFETISEHWDRKSSSMISTCIFSIFLVFDSLALLFFQPWLSEFLSSAQFCLPTAYIFLHSLSLIIIRATVYHLTVMPHNSFIVQCFTVPGASGGLPCSTQSYLWVAADQFCVYHTTLKACHVATLTFCIWLLNSVLDHSDTWKAVFEKTKNAAVMREKTRLSHSSESHMKRSHVPLVLLQPRQPASPCILSNR